MFTDGAVSADGGQERILNRRELAAVIDAVAPAFAEAGVRIEIGGDEDSDQGPDDEPEVPSRQSDLAGSQGTANPDPEDGDDDAALDFDTKLQKINPNLTREGLRTNAFEPSGKSEFTRAGHALTKHAAGQRTGSTKFPRLSGNDLQKDATARQVVNEVLDNPRSQIKVVPAGRFAGGVRIIDPSGRSLIYDSNGVLRYFGD